MKIDKIKEKLKERLRLFENNDLTNDLVQNIREAIIPNDDDNEVYRREYNDDDEVDDEINNDDPVMKPSNGIKKVKPNVKVDDVEVTTEPDEIPRPKDVPHKDRVAQPIATSNNKPQVKPLSMVSGGLELTNRDKGLKLTNSDNDIKRIIDSNMMVKIKYKPSSDNQIGDVFEYNAMIYVLGLFSNNKKAIRVYNLYHGRDANTKNGWKTFSVENIESITVTGLHMGKKAISDYLSNAPKGEEGPAIQGYNHSGDKTFKSIIHQKVIQPTISNTKLKN